MPTAPPRTPIRTRAAAYIRPTNPAHMKFTRRDGHILEAIHAYDGVLADYQIRTLFFSGQSQVKLRLRLLFQQGYLARPSYKKRASLTHMVYWLDTKGAAYVAGLSGATINEFPYVKEPRWSQLDHDIAVNDFRIAVTRACNTTKAFTVEEWIPQSEFYSYADRVEYTDKRGAKASRTIRPDAYIILRKDEHLFRFLLELDMATESNVRFAREKVLPGVAYVKSEVYKQRFGHNSGRFLVVTTSDRKLRNMKRQAELAAGHAASLFYFATFNAIHSETLFTGNVWFQGGKEESTALFVPRS